MVFYGFSWFFHGFYGFSKELDFKELEIHRYSLLDIHQWISMDFHQWILMDFHQWIHGWFINEYGLLSLGPSLGFHWAAFGPHGSPCVSGARDTLERPWVPPRDPRGTFLNFLRIPGSENSGSHHLTFTVTKRFWCVIWWRKDSGYPWIIHGYPWLTRAYPRITHDIFMDTHGYLWISMDLHVFWKKYEASTAMVS